MNRYNVFNNIHKGLRSMLFDVQLKLQQTDFDDPAIDAILTELDRVLDCIDEHGHHEDRFLLAPIASLEPALTAELEADHVKDHQFSEALRSNIGNFRNASEERKEIAGRAIYYALNDFIAFNLYHMNKEETVFLPLLWKHFSDLEILGMQQQIVASVNPQFMEQQSRWILRSITPGEAGNWLAGIRKGAPVHVYEQFTKMAGEEMPLERFSKMAVA